MKTVESLTIPSGFLPASFNQILRRMGFFGTLTNIFSGVFIVVLVQPGTKHHLYIFTDLMLLIYIQRKFLTLLTKLLNKNKQTTLI